MSTPPHGGDPPPQQPPEWGRQPERAPQPQWRQDPQWQQQPQWPQQPQWQGAYQPAPPTPGKAIASLVLGICGIVLCPLICSVIGLVLGYGARKQINASGGRLGGRGIATAGIVTSWVGLALWGLFALAWVLLIAVGMSVGTSSS